MTNSYLVLTNSNNEYSNADCDFALVDFSPKLLRKLSVLKAAFLRQEKQFSELTSWELSTPTAVFISRRAAEALLGEEKFEKMDTESGETPFPVPLHGVDLEKFDATNSDEMVISAAGVWWRIFPQHTDIHVSSNFFSWEWFTQCAHCGLQRREHTQGKCFFISTSYAARVPGFDNELQTRRRRPVKRRKVGKAKGT